MSAYKTVSPEKVELMELLNKYSEHMSKEDVTRISELLNILTARPKLEYIS